MHLSGFMLFAPAPHMINSWVYPEERMPWRWYEPAYWENIARTLERGKFDLFFFADGWAGGATDAAIRYAIQFPNHDPVSLVTYLSAVVKKLGFAVTMSTTFYNPFMLTRKLSTLDHLTEGRIGWNIVCSIASLEARNFGLDDLPPHDERYDRADEYMDLCYRLWSSWDDDAMVMDMDNIVFAHPDKVHKVDFKGRWYRSEGPFQVIPSPQGRPYLFQAGSSERGREFSARHAECMFAVGAGAQQMRALADDMAARTEQCGRAPDSLKILWSAQPIVADSRAEAQELNAQIRERIPFEASIALMSSHFNIDLSKLDPDQPVGDLQVSGTKGMLEIYTSRKPDITLREIADTYLAGAADSELIGTGDDVADYMISLLEEGGGDGFQITPSYYPPHFFDAIVDKLVPALQRRGAFRTDYDGTMLRDRMNEGR